MWSCDLYVYFLFLRMRTNVPRAAELSEENPALLCIASVF